MPPPPAESASPSRAAEEVPYSPRNFWAWVAYQFFYRIGWQFKMESTMMAGLVSYLAPDPRVAGLFTTLNTLGKNLSPLVAAPIVDSFRHKRTSLLLFWIGTVASWLALTLYLWLPAATNKSLSIWVFGVCYTLFFLFLGAVGVAQGALLGKIVPAGHRGRAMAMGMGISGGINVCAILLIYHVIQSGGFPEPRNYALAFSLTVTFFLLSCLSLIFVQEPASTGPVRRFNLTGNLRYSVKLARENRNLARLMVVNLGVGVLANMLQFYTMYWRTAGTMTAGALILATVLQVFWQSVSSSILGRVADRKGNRAIICAMLWIEATVPLAALVLGGFDPFRGHWGWYMGVYVLVGVRFPLFQILVN